MSEIPSSILSPLLDAWTARGSGLYQIDTESGESKVFLKAGRVVQVEGVEGLLSGVVEGALLQGELLADLGAVAVLGASIDVAMAAAADNLGRHIVAVLEQPSATARFTPGVAAPPGSFPLPQDLPLILVKALRDGRPLDSVRERLAELSQHRPKAVDSPLARSMDPAALRVLKRSDGSRTVEDIIGLEASGGSARAAAARRTLDMLIALGVVELLEPAAPEAPPAAAPSPSVEVDPQAGAAPSAPRRRSHRRSRGRSAEPEPEPVDPVAELKELAARLERLTPLEALGIPDDEPAMSITRERVDKAFRAVAQNYHPDRYAREDESLRDAAAQVFAVVNEKCAALTDPEALEDAKLRLDARQRGEIYVSDMDQEKAKVIYRKAEMAERTRAWAHGRELLAKARALDPNNPLITILDTFYAVVLRQQTPNEALATLSALQTKTDRQRAEVAYRAGRIYRLANQDKLAIPLFRKALEHNPNHVSAQRELRLLERRVAPPGR